MTRRTSDPADAKWIAVLGCVIIAVRAVFILALLGVLGFVAYHFLLKVW